MFPFIPVDRFLTQMVNKAPLRIDFSFMSDFARHEKPKGMRNQKACENLGCLNGGLKI